MNAQIPNYSPACGVGSAATCVPQSQVASPSPLMSGLEAAGIMGVQQGTASAPITDITQPQAMTTESVQYLNGFLRTQIGNRVRVEFLVGTNTYLEKSGKLLAVGANYIILQESMTDDLLVCDFFNIKFVTIYR